METHGDFKMTEGDFEETKEIKKNWSCQCGKEFKSKGGYYKHIKICVPVKNTNELLFKQKEHEIEILKLQLEEKNKQLEEKNKLIEQLLCNLKPSSVVVSSDRKASVESTNEEKSEKANKPIDENYLDEYYSDAMNIDEFILQYSEPSWEELTSFLENKNVVKIFSKLIGSVSELRIIG